MSHRKQRDGRFKAQVALEAIKNQQTIAQIASEYGVNPAQVSQWKNRFLRNYLNCLQTDAQKRLPITTS